jgi:hypothetical protein
MPPPATTLPTSRMTPVRVSSAPSANPSTSTPNNAIGIKTKAVAAMMNI